MGLGTEYDPLKPAWRCTYKNTYTCAHLHVYNFAYYVSYSIQICCWLFPILTHHHLFYYSFLFIIDFFLSSVLPGYPYRYSLHHHLPHLFIIPSLSFYLIFIIIIWINHHPYNDLISSYSFIFCKFHLIIWFPFPSSMASSSFFPISLRFFPSPSIFSLRITLLFHQRHFSSLLKKRVRHVPHYMEIVVWGKDSKGSP